MKLYLVAIVSITLLILFGDQNVRLLAGVLIALGALPLWGMLRHFFQRQFWRDVGVIIAPSDERPTKEPPSARE